MSNRYLFILLFCATALFSQNNTSYKLLWKVSHKNSKKPSYLFGTMHVSDKRVFRFSDSLLPALSHVDAFAGEMNFENMVPQMMNLIFEKKKSNIRGEMSSKDFELLDEKIQNTFGAPFDSINTQDTWIFEIFLKRRRITSYHKDKETFLDTYLGGLAAQQQKHILGLETLEEYSDWNNRLSDKEKAAILLGLIKDKEETADEEDTVDSSEAENLLMQMYSAGDVEKMHKMFMDSAKLDSKFLFSSLNFRNVNMVNRMDSIMKKQSLFAAVGALHIGGDSGMVKLLRAKGYTVEPMPASFNIKKKLPEITKRNYEWAEFSPPNSNFKVLMPMRPFKVPMPAVPGVDMQAFLSMDMSKMNSFLCLTLKLGAVIPPEKEEGLMNTMIQNMVAKTKAHVVSKQYFGNETLRRMEGIMKKGREYSKFTLFHKEGEILILMMNGNKAHMYDEDASKFSTSVKLSGHVVPKTELVSFQDKAKGYSLLMPSLTTESNRNIEGGENKVHMAMKYNATPINGISYYLATYDYDDDMYISDPKASLDLIVDGLATRLPAWSMTSADTTVDHCVAKTYEMANKASGALMKGKVLVRDNRLIMFWCSGDETAMVKADAEVFMNSFKIQPYQAFTYKYQLGSDSSYKVKLGNVANIDTTLGANYQEYMPPTKRGYTAFYNDSITTTRFSIGANLYKKYYTPENFKAVLDTIRSNLRDSTTLSDTLVLSKELSYLEMFSKNENSYTRTRYVLGLQNLYEINAYASEPTLKSAHVTAIFNSFRPVDKKTSVSLKDPKDQFYKDLVSKDSSTAEDAYDALKYLTFKEKDLPLLEKLFKYDYPLDSVHYRNTKEMIWSTIFKQDIASKFTFAEKYFKANTQNPKDQLSLLNGLSVGMDSVDIPLLKKLIVNAPPKLDSLNTYEIRGLNYPSYAAQMFPEAYSLLDNAVWADFALDLVATAASDSSLSKESLQPYADKIINLIDRNVLGGQSLSKANWEYTNRYILHLLAYLNHAKSIELLNRFMAKNDVHSKYLAARQLLELHQKLNLADIQYISNDIFYRKDLYSLLKEFKQVHLFPPKFANQKSMAIAHLAWYMNDEEYVDTTSITVLKEKVIDYAGKKGRVYLLKFKFVEGEVWYTALSALHPENKKLLEVDALQITSGYKELKEMTEAQHLEYLIAKFKEELSEE